MIRLGKTQEKIVRYLERRPQQTEQQIRRAIGRKSSIYDELNALHKRNLIYKELMYSIKVPKQQYHYSVSRDLKRLYIICERCGKRYQKRQPPLVEGGICDRCIKEMDIGEEKYYKEIEERKKVIWDKEVGSTKIKTIEGGITSEGKFRKRVIIHYDKFGDKHEYDAVIQIYAPDKKRWLDYSSHTLKYEKPNDEKAIELFVGQMRSV